MSKTFVHNCINNQTKKPYYKDYLSIFGSKAVFCSRRIAHRKDAKDAEVKNYEDRKTRD